MAPLLMNNAFLADFRRVCWGECVSQGFCPRTFCPEFRSRSVLSAFVREEGRSERLALVGYRCLLNLARKLRPSVARRSGWFGRQSGWTTRGLAEGWA